MTSTRTIDALRRFWWVALAFVVAGAVVGGLPTPQKATDSITRWTASHTLLVSSASSTGSISNDPLLFNQLQLFATTGQVPARVVKAIGYDGEPAALAGQISVLAEQQTGALRITTVQSTAEQAVRLADAFGDQLTTYLAERQDELEQIRVTSSLTRLQELEAQLSDAEAVSDAEPDDAVAQSQLDALSRQYSVAFEQFNSLQIAEQTQLVLTTLERAQPVAITESGGLGAPTSRMSRGLLGAVAGTVLGAGSAVLLARSDRRIRTREQAEEVLGMAAHAIIPLVDSHQPDALAVVHDRHDPLSDSYRTLRSIIAFLDTQNARDDAGGSVVIVASPGPGDGKTSMTANLTAAFVEAGNTTVAINSDFRRPTLCKRMGIPFPEPVGLALSELEHAPLELVLASGGRGDLSVLDLSPIAGASPGDLARVTARLLPRVAAISDVVVIDTSPVGATAEVLELLPHADTIVVVIKLGHTSIQSATRSMEMIRRLSTGNIVLAVVGGSASESGYYHYYYASAPHPEEAPTNGRFGRKKAPSAEAAIPL